MKYFGNKIKWNLIRKKFIINRFGRKIIRNISINIKERFRKYNIIKDFVVIEKGK